MDQHGETPNNIYSRHDPTENPEQKTIAKDNRLHDTTERCKWVTRKGKARSAQLWKWSNREVTGYTQSANALYKKAGKNWQM